MKGRTAIVVGFLVFAFSAGSSSVAWAQGGGTPARLSALEASVSSLQAQVDSLHSLLAAESSARITADASALAAANAYTDSVLAAGGSEATSALMAFTYNYIYLSITEPAVVVRLHAVPPGTYAVIGKVVVGMNAANCFLSVSGDGETDSAFTGNGTGDFKNDTLTMVRTTTLTSTEDMTLMCSASTNTPALPAYANGARILALKIASKDVQDGTP